MSIKESLSELPESELKKIMLKKILEEEVDTSDEEYQKRFKETYKVNLDIDGLKGYQIFEQTKYTYKYGEHLEDPDVTITYRDMEYVRQFLRGEIVFRMGHWGKIEWGQDNKKVWQMNRKDNFIFTRMRTNERNAQVLLAKIPFFDPIVRNFGTSRQGRYLRDEPEPIGPVGKGEIESLMRKMLSESVDVTDELYKNNFKSQVLKVNWNINGIISYQIFEETSYNYELGKHIEEADFTLVIENPDFAKRFLLETSTNYAPILDDDDNLIICIKTPVVSVKFKDPDEHRWAITKLPFVRTMMNNAALNQASVKREIKKRKGKREDYGTYIPVNLPMGEVENVVVPYKVFEHFINKASNIVLRTCPCRERGDCQNHSKEYGCIYMGDDTKNLALAPDHGYLATKEQALEHVKNAIADGLVPMLGRGVDEAEDGQGVVDTGRFLSCCFCCECCCVIVKLRQYDMIPGGRGFIEGTKIKVDLEKCEGCGTCIETCPFKLRQVVDGKSVVDPNKCIGCGRCIEVCPNGAISVDIEDPDYVEKFIAKVESLVDVTEQTTKT
jgi:UDP-glucose 4-epimerase